MAGSDRDDEMNADVDELRSRLLAANLGIDEVAELTGLLADALGRRYQQSLAAGDLSGAASDLGELIDHLQAALAGLPAGFSADILTDLARLHSARSTILESHQERTADLDAAISYARAAVAIMPRCETEQAQGQPSLAAPSADFEPRLLLGLALIDRSNAEQDGGAAADALLRSYRDDGIAVLTAAMRMIPAGDPAWLIAASELGPALYDRYCDASPGGADPDGADLEAAIDLLLAVAAAEPAGRPVMYLALALAERLASRPDANDLDLMITWCNWLLADSDSAADDPEVRELLGSALLERANESGQSRDADLDSAIDHLQAAVAGIPAGDPGRGPVVAQLAQAYWQRIDGEASRHDLVDAMTACAAEAWTLLPVDDEDRPMIGCYFVTGIHEQLLRPDAPFDVAAATRAIEVLTQIEPRFADEQLHLTLVLELGHFLVARGQATGSAADLLAAQPWLLLGASKLPAGDPAWSQQRQTLAADMSVLANLGMDADHLDQALALLADAVSGHLDPDPARSAITRGTLGALLAQRAAYSGSREDLNAAIVHLTASHDQAPPGHPYRIALAVNLAGALLARFQELGQAADLDAARFYLGVADGLTGRIGAEVRALVPGTDMLVAAENGLLYLIDGMRGDRSALDEAVASLRLALTLVPAGHPYRHRVGCDLGLALTVRASAGAGRPEDLAEAARELGMSAASPRTHMMSPIAVLRAGGALIAAAAAAGHHSLLREAIDYVTVALDEVDSRFGGRYRFEALLGLAAMVLYQGTSDAADLDTAVARLESAAAELEDRHFHPQYANCMFNLARARRSQGRKDLGREAGFAALRGRARDLLLQSGTSRSLDFARLAAAEAAQVVGWCLDDGSLPGAVEALELGRGLILHAATIVAELPAQLALAGHGELAEEWQRASAAVPDNPWDAGVSGIASLPELIAGVAQLRVPDDLRARTLAVLAGSAAEQRLLAPPSAAELASALIATDADALVYLIGPPAATRGPGRAVIVRAASAGQSWSSEQIILAGLRGGQGSLIELYKAAHSAAQADASVDATGNHDSAAGDLAAASDHAIARWRHSLGQVCDWAWSAVMEPILGTVAGWQLDHTPRLVLIPVGELSLVPWHAARSRAAGAQPARYAVHDAQISYAASGRQLCEVAHRTSLPLAESPAVVGDPTGTLPGALLEATAIVDTCYPLARYLGVTPVGHARSTDGPGTPGEVLRLLPTAAGPGASMLHLGCHAAISAAPGHSRLILAGQQELRVDAILGQASGRPPRAPGGLVTLAACSSDLAASEYDEALTLATAFIAAGAVTVVGARWQIPDETTSLLMFMFHYLMWAASHPPREALRLAQLWLLDPGRSAPPDMPAELAEQAARPGLDDPMIWAGIIHHGR